MENELEKVIIKSGMYVRVDSLLKKYFPHLSNTEIDLICETGCVRKNSSVLKKGNKIKGEVQIYLTHEQKSGVLFKNNKIKPVIVYEDDDIIFLDKPYNMPAVANTFLEKNALVNLLASYRDTIKEGGILNAGSINRLDNGTSGLVLFAKNDRAYKTLYESYHGEKKECEKYYMALVENKDRAFPKYIEMRDRIDKSGNKKMCVSESGKEVFSEASVLLYCKDLTLLLIRLYDGARHQIRLHLSQRRYPILGDSLYGGRCFSRLMLHSYMMKIKHPTTKKSITVSSMFDYMSFIYSL